MWDNMHYFKGQHRSLPAANVARQVPAVTGACMMVERELYERMGGLSHRYLQGGYEDSDFCLRLIDEGREHWYMPGAELYHLEDQSYPEGPSRADHPLQPVAAHAPVGRADRAAHGAVSGPRGLTFPD